jgi:hypothetical protein
MVIVVANGKTLELSDEDADELERALVIFRCRKCSMYHVTVDPHIRVCHSGFDFRKHRLQKLKTKCLTRLRSP